GREGPWGLLARARLPRQPPLRRHRWWLAADPDRWRREGSLPAAYAHVRWGASSSEPLDPAGGPSAGRTPFPGCSIGPFPHSWFTYATAAGQLRLTGRLRYVRLMTSRSMAWTASRTVPCSGISACRSANSSWRSTEYRLFMALIASP